MNQIVRSYRQHENSFGIMAEQLVLVALTQDSSSHSWLPAGYGKPISGADKHLRLTLFR
jgi:hypothetical protein